MSSFAVMHKAVEVCLGFVEAILILLTLVSFGGIVGLGTVGIIKAGEENDDRYITAYCNDSDPYEHVWLYWMAGASAAAVPFVLFGTLMITVMVTLLREGSSGKRPRKVRVEHTWQRDDHTDGEEIEMTEKKEPKNKEDSLPADSDEHKSEERVDEVEGETIMHLKQASLEKMTCGAVLSVFIILLFLSLAILCMLWGIAVAYDNSRTPNKSVRLYIGVDVIVGIAMPLFFILAAANVSVFLEYITSGRIDTRDLIAKMLSIKLVKGKKAEYWVIQNVFFFQLSSHDTEIRKDQKERKMELTCMKAFSRTPATWILGIISSLGFLLSVSYFMDKTVTMSLTLQDWPHSSMDDVDCFLSKPSFLYVSPAEQHPTDKLHNCTVFFTQCQNNCPKNVTDFNTCIQGCASCLSTCTTILREDVERVRVCQPPPVETPSCPLTSTICTTPAITPGPSTSCPTTAPVTGSGMIPELMMINAINNTQRLDQCADLMQACSESVRECMSLDCDDIQECNRLLQACRKPPVILCFRFLQFGRSSDILEALSESFALFLTVLSFFSGTFIGVRILLQFKLTRWWGLGFVLVSLLLMGAWAAIIGTDIIVQENIIQMFQFFFGFSYIFLIGLLLLIAKLWQKLPDPNKLKEETHLVRVTASVV